MTEVLGQYYDNGNIKDLPRKKKKPLMEKRRRARINTCLTELKSLVLQALHKDGSQCTKLEKADILEMTVRYLRSVQRSQIVNTMTPNMSMMTRYHSGYSECAQEVVRYLSTINGVSDDMRMSLLSHLASNAKTQQEPNVTEPPRAPLQPLFVQIPSTAMTIPGLIAHIPVTSYPTPPSSVDTIPSRDEYSMASSQKSVHQQQYFIQREAPSPRTPSPQNLHPESVEPQQRPIMMSSVTSSVGPMRNRSTSPRTVYHSQKPYSNSAQIKMEADSMWRPW